VSRQSVAYCESLHVGVTHDTTERRRPDVACPKDLMPERWVAAGADTLCVRVVFAGGMQYLSSWSGRGAAW
jgi:hypothetical protein